MKFRIAAALLLAGLIPSVSSAWIPLGSNYQGGVIQIQLGDICDSLRFPLTPGNCSGAAGNPDWRLEVQEAFTRWHEQTMTFTYFSDPEVGAATPGECDFFSPNSTFFLDDICGVPFGGSTLAVAATFAFFDGVALHSDVVFNTAWTWGAFDDAMSNHPGEIDFRRVAVHEFGHVAGLDHPFHQNAIMAPFIQDVLNSPAADDVAGMNAIYGVSKSLSAPDQNGNSADEIVHVRRTSTGTNIATVRDSSTGAILKSLSFLDAGYQTVDAAVLPDEDGSGSAELAVLAIRLSDLRGIVQIRNLNGADLTRTITFAEGFWPLKLRNIGDADGNGVSELAMLAVRESDLQTVVEIRNSFGAPVRRNVFFATGHSPVDFDVIVDPLAVEPPRLAVLMLRWSDLRGVVEMRDSIGDPARSKINVRSGATPITLEVIEDGGTKIAVLASRDSDGRALVEIKDAGGALGSTVVYFNPGNRAVNMTALGDVDGDTRPDLAVVSIREADGRVNVQTRNSDGSNARIVNLNASSDSAGSIFMLDDADGDGFAEVATQMSRHSDARVAVDWLNVAGPSSGAVTRIWMSP